MFTTTGHRYNEENKLKWAFYRVLVHFITLSSYYRQKGPPLFTPMGFRLVHLVCYHCGTCGVAGFHVCLLFPYELPQDDRDFLRLSSARRWSSLFARSFHNANFPMPGQETQSLYPNTPHLQPSHQPL